MLPSLAAAAANHEAMFDGVFQLANVAGVVVAQQLGDRPFADARDAASLQRVELVDEFTHEQGNIFQSDSQRGQVAVWVFSSDMSGTGQALNPVYPKQRPRLQPDPFAKKVSPPP